MIYTVYNPCKKAFAVQTKNREIRAKKMKESNAERLIQAENYLRARKDIAFVYLFGSLAENRESHLDVSGHIISNEKFRVPETYADMFRILLQNDILKESQLEAFEKMAKFRNIIVHDYEKIDAEIVLGILQKNLNDFEGFKEAIIDYLKPAE